MTNAVAAERIDAAVAKIRARSRVDGALYCRALERIAVRLREFPRDERFDDGVPFDALTSRQVLVIEMNLREWYGVKTQRSYEGSKSWVK